MILIYLWINKGYKLHNHMYQRTRNKKKRNREKRLIYRDIIRINFGLILSTFFKFLLDYMILVFMRRGLPLEFVKGCYQGKFLSFPGSF